MCSDSARIEDAGGVDSMRKRHAADEKLPARSLATDEQHPGIRSAQHPSTTGTRMRVARRRMRAEMTDQRAGAREIPRCADRGRMRRSSAGAGDEPGDRDRAPDRWAGVGSQVEMLNQMRVAPEPAIANIIR
jgi:hypothetical protein